MTDSNTPNADPAPDGADPRAKNIALVSNIVRGTGALFLLGSIVIGVNAGGAADFLGVTSVKEFVAGGLFVVACTDIFVVPALLARSLKRKD